MFVPSEAAAADEGTLWIPGSGVASCFVPNEAAKKHLLFVSSTKSTSSIKQM